MVEDFAKLGFHERPDGRGVFETEGQHGDAEIGALFGEGERPPQVGILARPRRWRGALAGGANPGHQGEHQARQDDPSTQGDRVKMNPWPGGNALAGGRAQQELPPPR
jgi:hypothetical protein